MESPKFEFLVRRGRNWILTFILTCAEELKSPLLRKHSCRSQHNSVLTTCTFMFRHFAPLNLHSLRRHRGCIVVPSRVDIYIVSCCFYIVSLMTSSLLLNTQQNVKASKYLYFRISLFCVLHTIKQTLCG